MKRLRAAASKPPERRAERADEWKFVRYSTGCGIAPKIALKIAFMSSTLFRIAKPRSGLLALTRSRAFRYWSKYRRCVRSLRIAGRIRREPQAAYLLGVVPPVGKGNRQKSFASHSQCRIQAVSLRSSASACGSSIIGSCPLAISAVCQPGSDCSRFITASNGCERNLVARI